MINLSGAIGLQVARSPFDTVDGILEQIEADAVVVDFHAEVTSEKVAMGWHLDGRVAAVFGTHTHVPTADGRVLPQGHRVHLRRRHDRLADQRARGQAGAGAGLDDHADADPVRDRRGGRLGDGGGGRGQRAGAGGLVRAGDGAGSVRSQASVDSAAASATSSSG